MARHAWEHRSDHDELHDVVGGQFGWGPARHAGCLATALLRIGDTVDAVAHARAAIDLCCRDGTGTLVGLRARADIATASVYSDDLDAAAADLEPVWQISAGLRRFGLVRRLDYMSKMLSVSRYRGSPTAMALRGKIHGFATPTPALPVPGR